VGKRELERTRTGSLASLAVAVVATATGLFGHPVLAWILAAGALAVLGLVGTAVRPPAVPPEPPPAPVPLSDVPNPDIGRVEELSTAVEHLESAIRVLRERAAGHGADEQLDECDRRMAGSVEMINTFAASVSEACGRLDILRSVMFQIMGQISEMSDISDRISKMVDTIRKIASQTNLLALNATIEAARAGEAGRSFAVVAGEVRKLAEDSRAATESIDQIVTEVRELTEATIEVADSASGEVEGAKTQIGQVDGNISSVLTDLRVVQQSVVVARGAVRELTDAVIGTPGTLTGAGVR
jgi:methyl-accepting chemotaxis protein